MVNIKHLLFCAALAIMLSPLFAVIVYAGDTNPP
jgi:hypothetical protein